MRYLLFFAGMVICGFVSAAGTPVTNQFSAGNPIIANDINADFQELADRNAATQASVTQNQSNISTLQSDVAALQGNISTITNSGSLKHLVGFSSGTTLGSGGLKVMTDLCGSDFPGSRICTSEEIVKSTSFPTITVTAVGAWVQPVLIGSGNGDSGVNSRPVTDSYSGYGDNSGLKLTCAGWSSGGVAGNGLVITTELKFQLGSCSTARAVACCM